MDTDTPTFDATDPDLDADDPIAQTNGRTDKDDVDVDAPLGSDLDDLREIVAEELSADPEDELFWLPVPRRPNWQIGFSTHVDHEKLQQFRRTSTIGKGRRKEMDELSFGCKVLALQTEEIRRNGETITHQREPVTFRTREFLSTLGVDRAVAGVRKLYGRDADILQAVSDLLDEAGYDDTEQAAEDPMLR